MSDLLLSGYRSGVDGDRCAYLLGVESTEVTEAFDSNRLLFRFSVLQGRTNKIFKYMEDLKLYFILLRNKNAFPNRIHVAMF